MARWLGDNHGFRSSVSCQHAVPDSRGPPPVHSPLAPRGLRVLCPRNRSRQCGGERRRQGRGWPQRPGGGGRVPRRGGGRVSAHGRTSLRRCGEEFPIGWAAASHCCAGNGAPDPSPLPAASPGRATVWAFTNIPRRPRAGAWSVASIASRLMRGCERLGRRHGGMGVALLQATDMGRPRPELRDVGRDRSRPAPESPSRDTLQPAGCVGGPLRVRKRTRCSPGWCGGDRGWVGCVVPCPVA